MKWSAIALGILAALEPDPVEAAAHLSWSAPPSCPSEVEVRDRLRTLLDPRIERPPVRVVAEVSTQSDGAALLRVTVSGGGEPSERTFVSPDCDELAATAALVAAIAIDPLGVANRVGASSSPPPEAQPKASEPPPPPRDAQLEPAAPPAEPSRVSAEPWSAPAWALYVGAGPLWSEQRLPTATLQLLATRGWRLFAVRFGAEGWLPQRFVDPHISAPEREIGIRVGRLLGRFEGCVRPGRVSLSAPICLGLNGGGVLARAYGVPGPQTRASLSSSVLGNVGVVWRPVGGRLGVFGAVEGAVQLTQARFHIGSRVPGYAGSLLSASVVGGVEVRLGDGP